MNHRNFSSFSTSALAFALVLGAALGAGCAPERVKDASSERGLGNLGPYAVDRFDRTFRVRVDESVFAEVYRPVDAFETPVDAAPLAVVVQGGLVPIERYRWLAIHLASRGMIAVMPQHPLDLAFFGQPNVIDVAHAVRAASNDEGDPLFGAVADAQGLITGHSLGAVVAAKGWTFAPGQFSHLAMIAGLPDPADIEAVQERQGGKVLSVVGAEDARIGPQEVAEGAAPFGDRATVAVVEGANHYQYTNDPTADELATDGEATVSIEVAQQRAMALIDLFIADLVPLPAGTDASIGLPATWPQGTLEYDSATPSEETGDAVDEEAQDNIEGGAE